MVVSITALVASSVSFLNFLADFTFDAAVHCVVQVQVLGRHSQCCVQCCCRVVRYPSKSAALVVQPGGDDIIFRSDSNGEDLEGCV